MEKGLSHALEVRDIDAVAMYVMPTGKTVIRRKETKVTIYCR